jgi:MoxR-like ATPase
MNALELAGTPEEGASPREKLLAVEGYLGSQIFEREEETRGMLCALLTRNHVLLLGPKGAAKSRLARLLCATVSPPTADGSEPFFRALVARDSTADELFGPVSNEGFEKDTFRRNTAGMLPEARVALIEEIFNSNSTLLDRLLLLLNEGLFKNGTLPEAPVPLELLVGTSNHLPDERENLDALFDRFLLRFEVSYLKEHKNVRAMLEQANAPKAAAEGPVASGPSVSPEELSLARTQVAAVDASPVFDALDEIVWALKAENIELSDRRHASALSLVKAQAYLAGRDSARRDDLSILQHVLWEDPAQIVAVRTAVLRSANPHAADARNLFDDAQDAYTAAMEAHRSGDGDATTEKGMEANKKLKHAAKELFELRESARDAGADNSGIAAWLERIAEMNEEVIRKCLEL